MSAREATEPVATHRSGGDTSGGRPPVLVVTHSAALGGAELGLLRYAATGPPVALRVLVLEEGPLVERLRGLGVDVVVPSGPGRATWRALRREVRRPHLVSVSWTLRAATWVGLVERRHRHLGYLQDLVQGGYFSRVKVLLATAWVLRRPGAFMVNSEATRRSLPPRIRRRARWLVHTPSGVAGPAGEPGSGGRSWEVLRPLHLGRIAPWKGPDLFLDACEEVARRAPGTIERATMAGGSFFGEEEFREAVERRAQESVVPVDVVGHQDDVEPLLAGANVLVHCSLTPEPFGQVLVQAMAHGLLVVAPDVGGPAEIVEHGRTGFLYRPGDAQSLADVLLEVRHHHRRAEHVAGRGRMAVERFTDERVAALITVALAEFAEVSSPAAPRGAR